MKINIKKSIILSLLFCAMLFVTSCGKQEKTTEKETVAKEAEVHNEETENIVSLTEEQMKSVGIELGKVEQKELTAIIKANGNLSVPNNSKGNATSLYGGVIKTLRVQIGSYVRKGQVIATIENPQFIQLQEDYLTTLDRITFAQQEERRQRELYAGNAGALKNLQNATTELRTLSTRRASLQQQIKLMGININAVSNGNLRSQLVVTSPLNGVVSNVFAKIGSYVDVSSPVVEIVDNSSLHLDLQVFEKDLPKLKVGQIIHFTLTNNPTTEYDATVFSIGSSFESDSKTIAIHCKVTGNKTGLIDGMNITGIISLNDVTAPAVPNEALVSADGKDYLFVVTKKEAAEHIEEKQSEAKSDHAEKSPTDEEKHGINFERVQVVKGVSNMGYTAITFVNEIPDDAQIVTKGAFFINAKLSGGGGHEH